tara:strand:+ start:5255 stop:5692 length:438 start_codon:yes stop_codon:yes gene_type:complete
MKKTHFKQLIKMYQKAPFNIFFNPRTEISLGKSIIEIKISKKFHHSANSLHGSVYFKMLDDAAFLAANSYVEDVFLVTTSFTTYLTRPVSNGKIKSYGKVVNMNNTQFITESVLFNEQKKEIGRGSGIFVKSKFPLSKAMGYLNQ